MTQGVALDAGDHTTKRCTRCNSLLPATTDFFHRRPLPRTALESWCIKCRREIGKAREDQRRRDAGIPRKLSSEEITERAEKRCPRCGLVKPRSYFSRNRRRADGMDSECSTCKGARESDRHAKKMLDDDYHREINRRSAAWRKRNPEQWAAIQRNRRALASGAEGTHTKADVLAQYQRQKGRCYWCKSKVGKGYHTDHVVPLSKGGGNGPENLVVACSRCNTSKRDKHPMDFAGVMF